MKSIYFIMNFATKRMRISKISFKLSLPLKHIKTTIISIINATDHFSRPHYQNLHRSAVPPPQNPAGNQYITKTRHLREVRLIRIRINCRIVRSPTHEQHHHWRFSHLIGQKWADCPSIGSAR